MCADVCGSIFCAHAVCEHDVCDLCVCAHVQKKARWVNSQSGGPTFRARQGRKLMFSDCECVQFVSGRRKRETRGERHREREREKGGRKAE